MNIVLGWMALLAATGSGVLWECADAELARLDAAALQQRFEAAGARQCRNATQPWADVVSCEDATALRAFGLPLRELRAEVLPNGTRRLAAITPATEARAAAAMGAAAAGLSLTLQAREDGSSVLLCVAEVREDGTDASHGALRGRLPAAPAGSDGWQVCARAAAGPPWCERVSGLGYRIAALPPGDYAVEARPLGADDGTLRAVLPRQALSATAAGGQGWLVGRVSVRAGAVTEVPELILLRLPQQ